MTAPSVEGGRGDGAGGAAEVRQPVKTVKRRTSVTKPIETSVGRPEPVESSASRPFRWSKGCPVHPTTGGGSRLTRRGGSGHCRRRGVLEPQAPRAGRGGPALSKGSHPRLPGGPEGRKSPRLN